MVKASSRTLARQSRIIDATIRLIANFGVESVTTRTIATESGVAEKTVFNLFGTKDRLIAAAAFYRSRQAFSLVFEGDDTGDWKTLLSLANAIAQVSLDQPSIARALAPLLYKPSSEVRVDLFYEQYLPPILNTMAERSLLSRETPIGALVRQLKFGLVGRVVAWASGLISDEELASQLRHEICIHMLPYAIGDFTNTCRLAALAEMSAP